MRELAAPEAPGRHPAPRRVPRRVPRRPSGRPGGGRRRGRRALGALPFLAVAVLLLLPGWRHVGSVLPGMAGDNESFLWGLGFVPWALAHGHDPFVSTYLHAPQGINLAWNAWMMPVALLLWPVTALAGPIASYTLLMTGCFAASGWTAWRAARRFVATPWIALAVGLVYETSPYMVGHGLDHPMLVLTVLPPLVLLLGFDLFTGARSWRRTALWLGIALGVQVWLDEEVLADTALAALAAAVALGVAHRRRLRCWLGPLARVLALAGVLGLLIAGPYLLVQFLGPDRIAGRLRPGWIPAIDVANLVVPGPGTLLGSGSVGQVLYLDRWEATGYLGLLPVLAVLALRAGPHRRTYAALGAAAILIAGLTFGPHVRLDTIPLHFPLDLLAPWRLVSHVPLLADLLPGRLTIDMFLLVALLAGVGLERVWRGARAATGRSRRWGLLGAAVATAAAGALALPQTPLPGLRVPVPAFFAAGARALAPGCLAAVFPVPFDAGNAEAMVWQTAAHFRFRLLDGYALGPPLPGMADTFSPDPYPIVEELLALAGTPEDRQAVSGRLSLALPLPTPSAAAVRADLVSLHVCAVVVAYPDRERPMISGLTGVLHGRPRLTGQVALWPIGPDGGATA
jgi:hypothetical protein